MAQSIRIISGKWRSRKVSFPNAAMLRPTQDKIRETLFNWIAPDLVNSSCLDLFAGSGILGFECLSRGAAHVSFVDRNPEVISSIRQNAANLDAQNMDAQCATIPCDSIKLPLPYYELVFLDPPFGEPLIVPTLQWLKDGKLIDSETTVYFEMGVRNRSLLKESFFCIKKEKKTKTICYGLLQPT